MGRRFTRGRFVRPSPKTKIWIGAGLDVTTVMVAATSTLFASYNAAALALRPFTIMRTHLEILFGSDQSVATELAFGAFGQIIASADAVAAGAASVPTSDGDPDSPWYIYQGMADEFTFKTGVGFESGGGTRYIIDSKAMRKGGANENSAVVFENLSTVGAKITMLGRQLVQLH